MTNEALLLLSLLGIYSLTLVFYRLLGVAGLFVWTAIATLLANIEVLVSITAFGLEQTLGNLLFASTFLVTDILSEHHGKKIGEKAVLTGLLTSGVFVALTQSWFFYTPSDYDWAMPHILALFAPVPRILCASLLVYAVSQYFDLWCYQRLWRWTERKFGDKGKGLWLRNNGSTLLSQLVNSFFFTFGAFYGDPNYPLDLVFSIFGSTYLIYVFTSLLDTPFVYLAGRLKPSDNLL